MIINMQRRDSRFPLIWLSGRLPILSAFRKQSLENTVVGAFFGGPLVEAHPWNVVQSLNSRSSLEEKGTSQVLRNLRDSIERA